MHAALWPLGNADLPVTADGRWPTFSWWQLLSYGFLHSSPPHLLFNLLALWMFGSALERFWGSGPYLRFLLAAIGGAGVAQLMGPPPAVSPIQPWVSQVAFTVC